MKHERVYIRKQKTKIRADSKTVVGCVCQMSSSCEW